ncbi:MAG: hypothetical protein ACJ8C3_12085 [Microvirga sp.]|jgi:hypothetical protein|nr:hypothetical protein [Beijerinckiaceae bacterium]
MLRNNGTCKPIAASRRLASAVVIGIAALLCGAAPGRAQDPVALAQQHLYAGTLAAGETALAALSQRSPADDNARFGLAGVQFIRAVERLGQALYRHGLEAPRSGLVPILRLPVPRNPRPAPLTYEGFRTILQNFVDDLARVDATLGEGGLAQAKLPIDLARIRLDLNGDGTVADDELFWNILAGVDPRARGAKPESFVAAFDAGDAHWLKGYTHLLRGIGEFWLAHDFRPMFDQAFQLFFPRAQLPFAPPRPRTPGSDGMASEYPSIADAIALIHLWNWPVAEPERLPRVVAHLKAMAEQSRKSWAAILAETDDDQEWIPSPRQTSRFPDLPVTQERVDAWLAVMAELDAVVDGRKLVPHWRFEKGINLRRAILEHKNFDLVMWLTGAGVMPFLEDGAAVSSESWDQMVRAFEGNFFGYAIWFN